ncbi:MAG: hypothetical protein F6K19_01435 [Cyanothece sp. SIO1E1]|nr:hypothetical protein [Cyanothece sp. SIO1E1]
MPLPVGAITAGVKGALGLGQLLFGAKKKIRPRKSLEMPSAIKEADVVSENLANSQQMAGYGQAKQNIRSGTANAISSAVKNAGSGANALAAITAIQNNENDALAGLDARNAGFLQDAKQRRVGFLSGKANMDLAVQRDKIAAIQERDQRKASLMGAGLQNIMGGLNDYLSYDLLKQGGYFNDATRSTRKVKNGLSGITDLPLFNSLPA